MPPLVIFPVGGGKLWAKAELAAASRPNTRKYVRMWSSSGASMPGSADPLPGLRLITPHRVRGQAAYLLAPPTPRPDADPVAEPPASIDGAPEPGCDKPLGSVVV